MTKRIKNPRTNAPEDFQVDEGAPALLGSVVEVGPAAVSSKSSCSAVSRDEEYELATKEGTWTFLYFFGGGANQAKSSLRPIFSKSSALYTLDRTAQVRLRVS